MSRSCKKTPIFGNAACQSEKQDKRAANRTLRAAVRTALAGDAEVLPVLREVSNVWSFNKDGKHWWGNAPASAMRK